MANNYLNPARRVRVTSPKLSKVQRAVLEALTKPGTYLITRLAVSARFYHATGGIDWDGGKISYPTFSSLFKHGFIELDATMSYGSVWTISDTGRAALAANGGQR